MRTYEEYSTLTTKEQKTYDFIVRYSKSMENIHY
jgi:hypothetical protein